MVKKFIKSNSRNLSLIFALISIPTILIGFYGGLFALISIFFGFKARKENKKDYFALILIIFSALILFLPFLFVGLSFIDFSSFQLDHIDFSSNFKAINSNSYAYSKDYKTPNLRNKVLISFIYEGHNRISISKENSYINYLGSRCNLESINGLKNNYIIFNKNDKGLLLFDCSDLLLLPGDHIEGKIFINNNSNNLLAKGSLIIKIE